MTRTFRSSLLLSLTFFFAAAVLYFLDLKIGDKACIPSFVPYTLWSLVVILFLYGMTIYLFLNASNNCTREQQILQKKLATCTDTLDDVQSSLDEAVEKKTFEMAVINGSLNREIAERIQAETDAVKLKKRLQTILNSAGDGIFGIDTHGSVTFSNHKATELLGWSEEELIGKSHHDLVHHTRKNGKNFPVEECPIYMAYKDGDVHFENDDIFWTKSGRSFPVEYTSTPLLDDDQLSGAVVVFKDISKAKKMEKQLDLIVNSAGEGIFGLDIDGNVTFMNKAAAIMLGWTQEEMIGKSHHELIHHSHSDGTPYKEEDCPIFMACKDGQVHFKSDDIFWTKDGSSFPVEYNSTPIIEGKQLTGAVVVFRDLTTFS
ncbi:MAG TPA: PAS domain-containing protein [Desulfocapsa sulfexigens]|nr:PAS domain-containing protein [Desulfocapsa sulfexigens]